MLTKLAVSAAAVVIAAGTIAFAPAAFHQAATLATADDAVLALANPGAIASPDAPAKLARVGDQLQKVAGVTPQQRPAAPKWISADQWGQR